MLFKYDSCNSSELWLPIDATDKIFSSFQLKRKYLISIVMKKDYLQYTFAQLSISMPCKF